MFVKRFNTILVLSCLALGPAIASGQQAVHAVAGTVTAINAKTKLITVTTDDGSEGKFTYGNKPDGTLDFDKNVSADSTPASTFTAVGDHVVVYYCGYDDIRTVVALHDMGKGPLAKITGHVVKYDKRDRTLIIKNDAGAKQTIQLSPKAVAETSGGVVEANKFQPESGDQVRVTVDSTTGTDTALFIRAS